MPITFDVAKNLNSRKWPCKFSEWSEADRNHFNATTKKYDSIHKIGHWIVKEVKDEDDRKFYLPPSFRTYRLTWWMEARFSYRSSKFKMALAQLSDGTWLSANAYDNNLLAQSADFDTIVAKIDGYLADKKPDIDIKMADKAKTRDIHKEYIRTLVSDEFKIRTTGGRTYSLELPNVKNHMSVFVKTNDSENQEDWSLQTKGFSEMISLDPVIMTQLSEIYKRAALKAAMASV